MAYNLPSSRNEVVFGFQHPSFLFQFLWLDNTSKILSNGYKKSQLNYMLELFFFQPKRAIKSFYLSNDNGVQVADFNLFWGSQWSINS